MKVQVGLDFDERLKGGNPPLLWEWLPALLSHNLEAKLRLKNTENNIIRARVLHIADSLRFLKVWMCSHVATLSFARQLQLSRLALLEDFFGCE